MNAVTVSKLMSEYGECGVRLHACDCGAIPGGLLFQGPLQNQVYNNEGQSRLCKKDAFLVSVIPSNRLYYLVFNAYYALNLLPFANTGHCRFFPKISKSKKGEICHYYEWNTPFISKLIN